MRRLPLLASPTCRHSLPRRLAGAPRRPPLSWPPCCGPTSHNQPRGAVRSWEAWTARRSPLFLHWLFFTPAGTLPPLWTQRSLAGAAESVGACRGGNPVHEQQQRPGGNGRLPAITQLTAAAARVCGRCTLPRASRAAAEHVYISRGHAATSSCEASPGPAHYTVRRTALVDPTSAFPALGGCQFGTSERHLNANVHW